MGDIFNKLHTDIRIELFRSFLNCWYYFFARLLAFQTHMRAIAWTKTTARYLVTRHTQFLVVC